jgi:hypothetical protein
VSDSNAKNLHLHNWLEAHGLCRDVEMLMAPALLDKCHWPAPGGTNLIEQLEKRLDVPRAPGPYFITSCM